MKKSYCRYSVIGIVLGLILGGIGGIINENVSATSINAKFGFEGTVIGSQLKTVDSGVNLTTYGYSTNNQIDNNNVRSGTRNYKVGHTGNATFVLNYANTSYLTNFSFWVYSTGGWSSGAYQYIAFYNSTHQSQSGDFTTNPHKKYMFFLKIGQAGAGGLAYYSDYTGSLVSIGATPYNTWYISAQRKFAIGFDNSLGDMGLYCSGAKINVFSCNTTGLSSGWRVDRVRFYTPTPTTGSSWIDDLNFTISTSYTVGGTTGGCIDVSDIDYYSKNIEVMDGWIDISTPFIEFTSGSSLSLTPEVFELWVGSALYEGDSDTSNYFLYINGVSCGNPICFYLLSGQTYVLQWDLSTLSPIDDEVLIFELAHSIKFDGNNYWNIARVIALSPPSPTQITYRNYGTNGVLDGSPYNYGSCWKLYFSAFGTPENEENTDFDIGINLIGFNTHSIYNTPYCYIYDTIYFEVFSNRTDSYYHLNISKGATTQGNEQGYPKDIYSYHIIHGFTPLTNGNYTVSLCKDLTNTIVDHKHFNVTSKTLDYAIFTFPNPSNTGVNHGVTVYISDDTVFKSFYVSGVVDNDNVNNFNSSDRKIKVGTLDTNGYWSTSLVTFAVSGWEYWRLWGTNDNISFIPLTSPYLHYVNSLTQNNYIRTSLTNGEGYTGESFNVYGQHSYILSQIQVYLDNKPIKDVSSNVSFLIPYSFSTIGTHTFSLRIFNDGVWEIVDSVVVSIVIRPKGSNELGGLLPPPYSYIMGAIITIALMILPSIALAKIGISQSETLKYVPIFSGTMGFILSCLIGFFPWYSIFALLFVLILIIVVLYLSKNKQ